MLFRARDWLRISVLIANRIWPLRHVNRIPYWAAIRVFVSIFRRRPEIASIYLSHGLAGQDWIPGLSDIDLTVILDNALSGAPEYSFLEKFWITYDRLKRYFPMLGEVVIFGEAEFGLWQTYSSTTTHGRRWVLLHGRETAKTVYVEDGVWRKRALNAALWMYLESVPPCLSRQDSYLGRQDVARRARKIFRYLDRHMPIERSRDSTEIVAAILKALEGAAMAVCGAPSTVSTAQGDGIRAVIKTAKGRVLMVLEDRLDASMLGRLIQDHLPVKAGEGGPVLLSHSLFAYMITHYNPYTDAHLRSSGTVVSGEDPLPVISPPGRLEFVSFTLDRLAYLLTVTRGEELFSTREPLPLSMLEKAVTSGLAVQLLLRDDWVGSDMRAVEAACRSAFPDYYRELDAVREYLAAGNDREARRASFQLFRPIALGILDLAEAKGAGLMQH